MISVFQDKLAMELGYSMKYIFTEDQYGRPYEGSKDNPNEIPHDDLNLVILLKFANQILFLANSFYLHENALTLKVF